MAFTDDEAHVINMSLGGSGGPDDPLSLASDAAVDFGLSVAVSAGNSGPGMFTVGSPGTARKVTTAAASDDFDVIADFSSRGPVGGELLLKPDIAAPGVSIRAAALGGGHVDLNGTSMASPHVAGASALVRQAHPDWDPGMVKAALMNNSLDLGDRLWEQGAGRLQVPQAADTMVIATPPSFSTLANGQDATGTLTLWNVSDAEVTVDLTVETTVDGVTPSDAVSVAPPTLTISPGGTAEAIVMAGPIDPGDPAGWYESRIMADINPVILGPATHQLIHVPLLFYVEQAPIIVVSPASLAGDVVEAEILGETLTIANTGSGQLEFRIRARAVPEPLAAVASHPAESIPWADQPSYATVAAARSASGPTVVTPVAAPQGHLPPVIFDPLGDAIGGIADVVAVNGAFDAEFLHLEVVFADDPSIFPAVGIIHLDTDQNPGTGVPPEFLFGLPTQDIGVDFFLDLFPVPDAGVVLVVACSDFDCIDLVGEVPGAYVGNTLLVTVPLAMLGGDDGMMDVTGVVGDFEGPTDWFPDVDHGTVGGGEEPAPWICTDPDTGMLDPSTSLDVDVLLNCERALPVGLYMGEVVIEHNDPSQGPVIVPVSLTVSSGLPAEIDVDPTSFDEILGTDEMRTVQLNIINPDPLGGVLTFNISVENFDPPVAPWAFVSPVAGFVDPDTTTVIDLMLDASGLPEGVYLADLVIGNNDPDENPTIVHATLTVEPPDIYVEIEAVSSTQDRDQMRTADLPVMNTGSGTLVFDIEIMDTTGIVSLGGGGELTGQALGGSSDGSVGASNSGGSAASPSAYRWESAEPSDMHILIYADDAYHTAPNTFLDQALQALGLAYTAHYDSDFGGFEAALAGGTYDLVLFGNDNFGPPASTIDALNAYVMGGGKLIYHSWQVSSQLGHPLLDALGVMWVSDDNDPPDPVYWWEPGHPFFTNPEMVPELTQLEGGRYGVYGQYVEPMDGYEALAGYTTPGPDANQAALILGNEGRTVRGGWSCGST